MPSFYTVTDPMTTSVIIIRLDGNVMTSFMEDSANPDWQRYQEWLSEGNTPEPWPPAE